MSLQDQLLKAGLVSKDKAQKAKSAKRKQAKVAKKHKLETVDENKQAAQQIMEENAEKAKQLNKQKNAQAEKVAIAAQIKQLIETNQQPMGHADISFNFTDGNKIKKIEVSNKIHSHLSNGLLSIARLNQQYLLVPNKVAEKIEQRSSDYILALNLTVEQVAEDDPYADYQIPDDLMW